MLYKTPPPARRGPPRICPLWRGTRQDPTALQQSRDEHSKLLPACLISHLRLPRPRQPAVTLALRHLDLRT